MKFKNSKLILAVLFVGIIYRLIISSNGNFIFNMDNARDMVDVREMMVLGKLRIIGPTTAIDGVYNGPSWYYFLSIPFVLSGGNPYASILMEIFLWAIGGYFLLLLIERFYGLMAMLSVSLIWIASNFILLASQYAFNPNPTIFFTPVLIYFILKYIETDKNIFNILIWFLIGIFLQFEIVVGIFLPIVYIVAIIVCKKFTLLKNKLFYLGVIVFFLTLLPQIIFDLRHNFFMANSLLQYKSASHGSVELSPLFRFRSILVSYYDTLLPTFMNFKIFTSVAILIFFGLLIHKKIAKKLDNLTKITISFVLIPLICLIPLKIGLMRWHLDAVIVASIILVGFIVSGLQKINGAGRILALILFAVLAYYSINNMYSYILSAKQGDSGNSIFRNEVSAIDYVYKRAEGRNFKVYVYMPSVIDYPYQYLFWWYGLKKYGYLPKDYAYLPEKPEYIKQKERFNTGSNPPSSSQVFLIKEPDQIGQRHLWENNFKNLSFIDSYQVGSIIIETRKSD